MAPQVRYGKVRVAECPCCVNPPVEFESEEGRERRRRLLRHYRRVATVQLALGSVAFLSGAVSAVLAFFKPAFPYVACFPLVSAILMLTAGMFGLKASRSNLDSEIPPAVKRNVIVQYVLSVIGCTFCMLAAVFSSVGLGYCFTPDKKHDCSPNRDLRVPFMGIDITLGLLLFVTCLISCVLFCMHARTLGFYDRMQTMENEVNVLRAQVEALTRAQQQQQQQFAGGFQSGVPPPPAYSQISSPPPPPVGPSYGGFQYSGGGGDGKGSGGQWPAGY